MKLYTGASARQQSAKGDPEITLARGPNVQGTLIEVIDRLDEFDDTDPYAPAVYEMAARNFARLRAEAPLVQEATQSLYFYRLRMGTHEQTGLAACFSVDEYEANVIRKHERTRKDKEDDRTRHIVELRAQTGPVFLTYVASAAVDAVATRVTAEPLVI